MEDNSSVFFWLKSHILWTKIAHQNEISGLLIGWLKIHEILHVIFETRSQFFFKLCITLQCHERCLFCTFLAGALYDFQRNFNRSGEILPNLYFDSLLLLKVYKISDTKVHRVELCLMILKIDAKFE